MGGLSPKDRAELMRKLTSRVREATAGVKKVLMVMSGKGGVGKSITAASLAIALSTLGCRVAILDADVHGPSIPWLMGVEDKAMMADDDGRIIPVDAGGVGVVSVELALDRKDLPLVWRGPLKTRAILDLLGMVKWGELDYLVVDLPPGTGDEPQTVARYLSVKNPEGVLVAIPGRMVTHIVSKARNFAEIVGIKVLGLVVNMAYYRCPSCGHVEKVFGEIGDLGLDVLAELPLDPRVSRAADEGRLTELFREEGVEWVGKMVELARKVAAGRTGT
ncbi:MAG: P-loop NTPase [Desulfurococcales archaeon]|nr:P-loop NTPase [Desulfurococcales archaeon]